MMKTTTAMTMMIFITVITAISTGQQPPHGGGDIEGLGDAGGPYTGVREVPLQFQGTVNGSNPPFTYEWDFSYNGTFNTESTQLSPLYTYSDTGSYTAALRITDNASNTSISTASVTIEDDANTPPIACFSWNPYYPHTGTTILFSDMSYDLDGYITAWRWDFGNGATSSREKPSHMYGLPGSYTVTLTVTDDDGENATKKESIIVYLENYYDSVESYTLAIYTIDGRYPVPYVEIIITDETGKEKTRMLTDQQGMAICHHSGMTTAHITKNGYNPSRLNIGMDTDKRIVVQMDKTEKEETIATAGMLSVATIAILSTILIIPLKKRKNR